MRVHKIPRGKALVAGVAALALVLTACSSSKSSNGGSTAGASSSTNNSATSGTKGTGNLATCATSPNTCNKAATKPGGQVSYVLEKTISGWNINNANSNTFEFAEVMDGILPAVYNASPDLKPFLNTDLMVSATQTNADPQTLVYVVKPNANWSDGQPIDIKDFLYGWKTQDPAQCPKCVAASTSGYASIKSMTGSSDGRTITVVMKTPFTDWQSMFGSLYPAHVAAAHGNITTPAGLADTFNNYFDLTTPTYSGGPFMVKSYTKDTSVTEVPNPTWYGATKSSLTQVNFRIITEQTQEVPALQNNEVQAIYPQPNQDIVQSVGNVQGVDSYLGKGLTWEHLDFNEKNPLLADKVLRTAIFTAVNRQQIISKTIGQFVPGATPLGNHMYVPGQDGYTDNVTASGQGSGDLAKAKAMLTGAGYTGVGTALKTAGGKDVNIRCSFTTGNVLRSQTCVLLQNQLAGLGIKVTPTPLTSLGKALASGNFDMIIFAWVGTPFVTAGAQQIFELAGGNDYGMNNDPAMEAMINQAATTSGDPAKVKSLMNQADVALTADAYNLPLFQKPTYIASYSNIANIRDNATSVGPPYNIQEWGQRSS
ncbi:MAG: ABC transporter family substrate-binding protein [Actinomycetota bacterium]|nr:ABC transporter family substrate-binding protein [Actinomycetota bacterium]